jgi:hypothetical protein
VTTPGQQATRAAFEAALRSGASAAHLEAAVAAAFPRLQAFREAEDLILVAGESRRLLVRRVGENRFVTGEVASASASTNMLDAGGEAERDLDGLIREIATFANS